MRRWPVVLMCLLGVACSGDDDDDDDDGGVGADAAAEGDGGLPEGCATPDTECPEAQPVPSGPCVGPLSCDYLDAGGDYTWDYECEDGRWAAELECSFGEGPDCPAPPLSEICLDPFGETLNGATVELGPADIAEPFRTFEEGDDVDLVVGAQGGSMITLRVAVTGADVPACVAATMTVTAAGVTAEPQLSRITLHCGVSLPVFVILPTEYCEPATIPVELDVEIEGIGAAHATVQFTTPGKCVG